jgi:hypothetical protein
VKAINVVESKEFQEYSLYGQDNIIEHDLLHRTKLIKLIFQREHSRLKDDFKVGLQLFSAALQNQLLNSTSPDCFRVHFIHK